MNKQNELILTESALEDFKIFKMYMEKKKIYFVFLFLSAVFKKQQPSVALVTLLTTNKYVHPFNHSLAHSRIIVI